MAGKTVGPKLVSWLLKLYICPKLVQMTITNRGVGRSQFRLHNLTGLSIEHTFISAAVCSMRFGSSLWICFAYPPTYLSHAIYLVQYDVFICSMGPSEPIWIAGSSLLLAWDVIAGMLRNFSHLSAVCHGLHALLINVRQMLGTESCGFFFVVWCKSTTRSATIVFQASC